MSTHIHDSSCKHAHNHQNGAAETLDRAEKRCARAGVRLTPIRKQVLAALLGDHRPLGAYDLADRIKSDNGRRLAPISIYRALDFLMEQGLAHRLNSLNSYTACLHNHTPGTVVAFMICESCGGVDEDADGAFAAAIQDVAGKFSFVPGKSMIELSGRCEHCSAS
jgi:Fur family transcriptional regulator, zinc uptake regulator